MPFDPSKWANNKDGTAIIADDPYLEPFAETLRKRFPTRRK